MPPSGPHVTTSSTSWARGISQRGAGYQGPADTLLGPSRHQYKSFSSTRWVNPNSHLLPHNHAPAKPEGCPASLEPQLLPRGFQQWAGCRWDPASRPLQSPLLSQLLGSRETRLHRHVPGCPNNWWTRAPARKPEPSVCLSAPPWAHAPPPPKRRLFGPLARVRWAVPPPSQRPFFLRPQTGCVASSGGRRPWTWRAGPGLATWHPSGWPSTPRPSPRQAPGPPRWTGASRVTPGCGRARQRQEPHEAGRTGDSPARRGQGRRCARATGLGWWLRRRCSAELVGWPHWLACSGVISQLVCVLLRPPPFGAGQEHGF